MNVERLRHMQDILRRPLPVGTAFDLGLWYASLDSFFDYVRGGRNPVETVPECGTVCCAIGLAMDDPTFQAQGLHKALGAGRSYNKFEPRFKGNDGIDAVASFFDIPMSDAMSLFFLSQYRKDNPTRQDVINKIEKYIMVLA